MSTASEILATNNATLVPYTRPASEHRTTAARAEALALARVPASMDSTYIRILPGDRVSIKVVKPKDPKDHKAPKNHLSTVDRIENTILLVTMLTFIAFCVTHPKSFEIFLRHGVAIGLTIAHTVTEVFFIIANCFTELNRLAMGITDYATKCGARRVVV
ncbi:hypothetical protein FRC12_005339 [Ceratobasidium sp. 428]|nr:hypothetical protein FRC12_005339 [Ceratobasidium sp. 428]